MKMNPIGMMSYVYLDYGAKEMAEAVAGLGLHRIQLDPRQKGLLDEQQRYTPARSRQLRAIFAEREVAIDGVSAYINLLDPDPDKREANLRQLEDLIRLCRELGAGWIATETGSLHPSNQWAYHPDNASSAAWEQLVEVTARLQRIAVAHDVTLLLEGYVNNVLHTSAGALKLIDTLGTDGLGLVFDPFNYLTASDLEQQERAFDRLFADLIAHSPIAHAKDTVYTAKGIDTPHAGAGRVNWCLYAQRLAEQASDIPLYLEHLKPEEAEACLHFVQQSFQEQEELA